MLSNAERWPEWALAQVIGEDLAFSSLELSDYSGDELAAILDYFCVGLLVPALPDLNQYSDAITREEMPASAWATLALCHEFLLQFNRVAEETVRPLKKDEEESPNRHPQRSPEPAVVGIADQAGMLSDHDILKAIFRGDIKLSPLVDPANAINGCSIDLRLGKRVRVPRIVGDRDSILDATGPALQKKIYETLTLADGDTLVIEPQKKVLWYTEERITLGPKLAGRLDLRSHVAEILGHTGSNLVHNGFDGQLKLELRNELDQPVRFAVGQPVVQLSFCWLQSQPGSVYKRRDAQA